MNHVTSQEGSQHAVGASKQSEIDRLEARLKEAEALVVSVFSEERVPQFQQGTPNHELLEPVTAAMCTFYVQRIEELNEQLAAANEKNKILVEALTELCRLKAYKDALGKTADYLRDQPIAWRNANSAIALSKRRVGQLNWEKINGR